MLDSQKSIELAKKLFSDGQIYDALQEFKKNLGQSENNYWVHYWVGLCYKKLKSYEMATFHLETAHNGVDDSTIALEYLGSILQIGDAERFFRAVENLPQDSDTLARIKESTAMTEDFRRAIQFWNNDSKLKSRSTKVGSKWRDFFNAFQKEINAVLAESKSTPKISFSKNFTNFLSLLQGDEVAELIRLSYERRIHFQFSSWDLSGILVQNENERSAYNAIPQWLKLAGLREPVTFVFDSSEEAPSVKLEQLKAWARSMYGENNNHKYIILTANSKNNVKSDLFSFIEYNIYPILVTQENIDNIPTDLSVIKFGSEQYDFSLLNGMPRPHRCALMMLMKRENLLDKVNYSWWADANQKNSSGIDRYVNICKDRFRAQRFEESEFAWLRTLPERIIADEEGIIKNTHYLCSSINYNFMGSGRFHIVSETDFLGDGTALRLTEKALKPILSGRPFIILGAAGIVDLLRRQGFDVMDDVINHAYDTETDPNARIQAFVAEMRRLTQVQVSKERHAQFCTNNFSNVKPWLEKTRASYVANLFEELRNTNPVKSVTQ